MSFWDLFLSDEEREKKRAEENKRREEAGILKINKEKKVNELLDNAVREHGETKLLETAATISPKHVHKTKLIATEKRILFTVDSRWDDAIKDFIVVDIPYYEMNNMYYDPHVRGQEYHFVKNKKVGANMEGYTLYIPEYKDGALLDKLRRIGDKQLSQFIRMRGKSEYINVCWNCHAGISSEVQERCPICKMFICSKCGACFCDREKES